MQLTDTTDRALLNRIQSHFPITHRPYLSIANDMGLTEIEVIERIKRLKENGIIRRIGANFIPNKLGYVSTLCAARVPENKIDPFADAINRYPGVTHNYQRNHEFNIWFTFIAFSMEEIDKNLKNISRETGIIDIINLPATKTYKIKTKFEL